MSVATASVVRVSGCAAIDVDTLRSLFRHLQDFENLYEGSGVDSLVDGLGRTWSLWDVRYLFEQSIERLPDRQAQAIRLFLYEGKTEKCVAVEMGIKPENPIGQYATRGLETIVALVLAGDLPRFRVGVEG